MSGFYKYLTFKIDEVNYVVPMDYVAYIVSASEPFPYCIPHRRKHYIDCIMKIEQKLVTVVELSAFRKDKILDKCKYSRPLILILDFQNSLIGLLTDYIGPPIEFSELKLEKDSVEQQSFLTCGMENFILFDVPQFYTEMEME